ncbi:DUF4998 domain-containing protein [Mariniflexile sp. AS56]|uniref:DUF4998 domain-containing protein n=1 Tax=Mariniflexile sp. AS56 TaxID=3063957 RepID=UPI0026F14F34|nr:DUF4998 domain-containing protein [Mariniflexile sp. AS56]MDO7174021.1 DUF4998 domain-containing protein [Mariniflexile sp. AS56]
MKNILIITLALICLCNCSEMNELHQPYLDRGETIYPAKPDSLISFSGQNRVKLQWYVYSDLSIKKARIFWNDKADSLDVPITVNQGVRDTIGAVVENLKEGGYVFEVFNLDTYGNKSIPVVRSGKSLGGIYQSSLNNRRILSYKTTTNNITFTMSSSDPADYVYSEFKYFDNNNLVREAKLDLDNLETIKIPLDDIDISKNIQFRSVYQPFDNAIDLFYTEFAEFVIQ